MKNTNTRKVPFLACSNGRHLLAVQPGVPRDEALDHAADFLGTAHTLMVIAEEFACESATAAATLLVEMALATVEAVKVDAVQHG